MQIALDCRMIHSSGVGTYMQGILPHLLKSGHDFLLLGDEGSLLPYAERSQARIIPYGLRPFSPAELMGLPSRIRKAINACDAYFSPFFNLPGGMRIPVFITIHDIIFADVQGLTSQAGLAARMWFYRRAWYRAEAVFTVSAFSKERIGHHLGTQKNIIITHTAPRPQLIAESKNPSPCIKKPHIIFVGNIKKHKGLKTLIEAFASVREAKPDLRLIIVGSSRQFRSRDQEVSKLMEILPEQSVQFSGELSDEALRTIISESSLLVQPSLYEGFGLPPLEAMLLGTQALISDIPVFREIYADFPVRYVRPEDPKALAQAILELFKSGIPPPCQLTEKQRSIYTFEKTAAVITETITHFLQEQGDDHLSNAL